MFVFVKCPSVVTLVPTPHNKLDLNSSGLWREIVFAPNEKFLHNSLTSLHPVPSTGSSQDFLSIYFHMSYIYFFLKISDFLSEKLIVLLRSGLWDCRLNVCLTLNVKMFNLMFLLLFARAASDCSQCLNLSLKVLTTSGSRENC